VFALVAAISVAVLDIFLADKAASSAIDRGHSLCSLHLPLAAVASLPTGILHFRSSTPHRFFKIKEKTTPKVVSNKTV
jgi:hypothetical protein